MCKYCEGCSSKEHGKGKVIATKESEGFNMEFFIEYDELETNVYCDNNVLGNTYLPCSGIKINFCPMCGRDLRK